MNYLRRMMNSSSSSKSNSSSSYMETAAEPSDSEATTSYVRQAHHAGSWYSSDSDELDEQLTKFLQSAEADTDDTRTSSSIPNACISPHAGFRYSGPTAAYSYLALKEALLKNSSLKTIVVLHPSHHVYLDGCAISGASIIETPLGNLRVDDKLREQLLSTNKFSVMECNVDEEEHSGEMQYPFIAKIINDMRVETGEQHYSNIKILPIMIGSIKTSKEKAFGQLLSPYLADSAVFTIVSSDFCHWGRRFSYTPQPSKTDTVNEIYEYIEQLDKRGMDLIEMQRPGAFADYLRETSNTIWKVRVYTVYRVL